MYKHDIIYSDNTKKLVAQLNKLNKLPKSCDYVGPQWRPVGIPFLLKDNRTYALLIEKTGTPNWTKSGLDCPKTLGF